MKSSANEPRPVVVALHGLARTRASMAGLARRVEAAGFDVVNLGYPSTRASMDEIVARVRTEMVGPANGAPALHFVTHSLGGIVVRSLLADWRPSNLGRVVMIAPPSGGSEIVDRLGRRPFVRRLYGPVFAQLGTDDASLPNRLGPVSFETGVIAGSRVLSPLGWWFVPGPSDGTVAIERTHVPGMTDHVVLPHSHAFIMNAPRVAEETVHFLRRGCFSPGLPRSDALTSSGRVAT